MIATNTPFQLARLLINNQMTNNGVVMNATSVQSKYVDMVKGYLGFLNVYFKRKNLFFISFLFCRKRQVTNNIIEYMQTHLKKI